MKKTEFIKYYFKYKDKIYTYFLYRLNFDKELAEDMTSQTFLKAYRNLDTYDKEKSLFQTWLFTIAHNLLLNFYRDNKVNESVEQMELLGVMVKDELYLNRLINQLEAKLIIDKIQTLPSNYSQVLIMRLVNQLGYQEIAEIINKDEGNVRVLFSRGIKKISSELGIQ